MYIETVLGKVQLGFNNGPMRTTNSRVYAVIVVDIIEGR